MFADVKLKWKLKKFQDDKMERLTKMILIDDGKSDLKKNIESIKNN